MLSIFRLTRIIVIHYVRLYELVRGLSIAMNWEDAELTGASRLDV